MTPLQAITEVRKFMRGVFVGAVAGHIILLSFGLPFGTGHYLLTLLGILGLALWVAPPLRGDADYIEPSRRHDWPSMN